MKPDSTEGRLVQEMQDLYDQLQQVFAEGLYEGGDNFRKAEKNTTAEGGRIVFDNRISELRDGDILELIENCNHGEYALRTYIPLTHPKTVVKENMDSVKAVVEKVRSAVEQFRKCAGSSPNETKPLFCCRTGSKGEQRR